MLFQVHNEILWLLAKYCVAVANKQAFIHDKKSEELVTLFCFHPFILLYAYYSVDAKG